VDAYGSDSLSFFALRRDKSYLFSPSRRAFLAYRVIAGTALVSGDPVGDEAEIDDLLAELRRLARAHGGGSLWSARRRSTSSAIARLGSSPCRSGRRPCSTRASSRSRDVRSARCASRSPGFGKAGYSFRVVAADEVAPALEAELEDVSAAWRRGEPERGFSMTIDDLHVPGTVLALAEDADGRVGGFLHLAPSPAGGGWSLSAMRRRPDAPNGLTEFLVVEALAWARATGASELSLTFCALTDFLAPERVKGPVRWVVRRGILLVDNVFQLERLYSFNRKFSSRNGGAAISASSASPTCPRSASRISTPSPCSCRPAPGHAGARPRRRLASGRRAA